VRQLEFAPIHVRDVLLSSIAPLPVAALTATGLVVTAEVEPPAPHSQTTAHTSGKAGVAESRIQKSEEEVTPGGGSPEASGSGGCVSTVYHLCISLPSAIRRRAFCDYDTLNIGLRWIGISTWGFATIVS
jgi:hypothetical protein